MAVLDNINENLASMFKVVTLSSDSVSISANSYGQYAFKNVAPDGYEIFAIKSYFINAGKPHIYGFSIIDNQITASLWNNSANTSTTNISIYVICIKKM